MFALKRELLEALLVDAEWCKRLEKAQTPHDIERVFREFAEAKGFKVREVALGIAA